MSSLVVVQAQTASCQSSGKVLLPLGGKAIVIYQLEDSKCMQGINELNQEASHYYREDTLTTL